LAKEVALSNGMVALVDDEDYERVAAIRWHASSRKGCTYARANKPPITMHRLILGPPPGIPVDHANGNGLDNRRENLRVANAPFNSANSKRRMGLAGYRGVFLDHGKFRAQITVNGQRRYLGSFATAEDAAVAYDAVAREAFGVFARLNFPDKTPVEVAAERERAAIVAWMRDAATGLSKGGRELILTVSLQIEAGAHLPADTAETAPPGSGMKEGV